MITGWRAAAAIAIGLAVLVLLLALAVWVGIGLAVVGCLLWLNLVFLPRVARRLHVPRLALELICLPLLAGAGWLLGGVAGTALGSVAWLCAIGLPRAIGHRLRGRLRAAAQHGGRVIVLENRALRDPAAGRSSSNTPT